MATIYLKTYMNRIIQTYDEAREEYAQLWDDLEAAEQKNSNAQRSRNYSAEGKRAAREQFNREKETITAKLQQLATGADKTFKEYREAADNQFRELYSVNPEKLDMAALELLKSGVLTDGELLDMGEQYKDNATMLRMVSKYAGERAEKDKENISMRRLAAAGAGTVAKHLQGIDTLIYWCNNGLRPNSRLLSDGTDAHFHERAAELLEEYGDISKEV